MKAYHILHIMKPTRNFRYLHDIVVRSFVHLGDRNYKLEKLLALFYLFIFLYPKAVEGTRPCCSVYKYNYCCGTMLVCIEKTKGMAANQHQRQKDLNNLHEGELFEAERA